MKLSDLQAERERRDRETLESLANWRHPEAPAIVPGADWQAGVTKDNECFRPLLWGEPVVAAFAASVDDGWVDVYVPPTKGRGRFGDAGELGSGQDDIDAAVLAEACGTRPTVQRLRGFVELRAVRGES